MNWRRNLRYSLYALRRSSTRTLLSATSMAVGIGAIVVLIAVGSGAEQAFQEALEEFGRNLLAISAKRTDAGALRGAARQYETLTLGDAEAIAEGVRGVVRVAPISLSARTVGYRGETLRVTVFGTTPEFRFTNNQELVAGRFFDDVEVRDEARVVVIGAEVMKRLFRGEVPLGRLLQVDGMPFVVIGALREMGLDLTGSSQDDRIIVPLLTAQQRLDNIDHLDRMFVEVRSRDAMELVEAEIANLLRSRHDLGPHRSDDFTIGNQNTLLATMNEADKTLSRLLLGVAAITLGLGSVGLLAVSLLSVGARRGEIGLRLAVGALPPQILLQFLVEACMIAAIGATAGMLAGSTGIVVGERLVGWRLAWTWEAVAVPLLVSFGISMLFGAYPALRAARLDPIVTLRGE